MPMQHNPPERSVLALSAGVARHSMSPCVFCSECPWERLQAYLARKDPRMCCSRCCCAAPMRVGYTNLSRQCGARLRRTGQPSSGIDVFRVFRLPQLGGKHARFDRCGAGNRKAPAKRPSVTRAIIQRSGARRPTISNIMWGVARELADAGTHILGIKDMGGLWSSRQRRADPGQDVLKEETGLPIHFHTHDTSGISAASVLAACRGRRATCRRCLPWIPLSGMTSQPNFGSVVEALRGSDRDTGFDIGDHPWNVCDYWEAVRVQYAAFEADNKAGASEVYSARNAGRPVHQSQGAGPLHGACRALARGRARLCRRQSDVWRYRQGDAILESRRRYGDLPWFRPASHAPMSKTLTSEFSFPASSPSASLFKRRVGPAPQRLSRGAAEERRSKV